MDKIQELLNEQAKLSDKEIQIKNEIRELRGCLPPPCFGDDDCSSMQLATCPWRFDCGE